MSVELYPHNQATFNRMIEMFESSNRVAIVQPTGSGKSFIYLKWIEDHPNNHIAILSPSNEIFVQLREYGQASELEISDKVQMITYQALLYMSAQQIQDIKAGKIILDEFHRIGAELWEPAVQMLLDNNPHAKVLGATATPIRYLDEGKDMAALLFCNNLAQNMSLGEAVREGILPTPIYVPAWYDSVGKLDEYRQDILQTSNDKKRKELLEELERLRRSLEYSYGASKIFKEYMPDDHGKYIVFCRSVEHLTEMLRVVPEWLEKINPKVRCYVSINAELDRDEQLQTFKADNGNDAIKLLFTIDRLNEGIHVKGISGVIMLRPTTSPIIYLQQMGRALAAGNSRPLIFDLVNNYQSVAVPFGNGETKNVFAHEFSRGLGAGADKRTFQIFGEAMNFASIFRRLENSLYPSNNEIWKANLGVLKDFIAKFGRLPKFRESFIGLRVGLWLTTQKQMYKQGRLSEERIRLLTEVGVALSVSSSEAQWLEYYSALKEFIAKFGRLPKQNESFNELRVGAWLNTQKQRYGQGKLSEERERLLTKAGIDLSLDVVKTQWLENFNALKEFIAKFGRLPKQNESINGLRVGRWLNTQKEMYKQGRLSDERIRLLSEVRSESSLNAHEAQWFENLNALKRFIAEFSRLPTYRESFDGLRVGPWLANQKQIYRQGKLSDERIRLLTEAGIDLSLDVFGSQWLKYYGALKGFVAEFGRLPKQRESFDGLRIGLWLANQKQMYKQGKLSEKCVQLLTEAGVDRTLNAHETQWLKYYSALKEFIAEFGGLPKQKESINGLRIGLWLRNQKQMYKQCKLSENRIRLLEEVGVKLKEA